LRASDRDRAGQGPLTARLARCGALRRLLSEPIAGTQPCRREPLLCPLADPWVRPVERLFECRTDDILQNREVPRKIGGGIHVFWKITASLAEPAKPRWYYLSDGDGGQVEIRRRCLVRARTCEFFAARSLSEGNTALWRTMIEVAALCHQLAKDAEPRNQRLTQPSLSLKGIRRQAGSARQGGDTPAR
jgi:hypothetical protein